MQTDEEAVLCRAQRSQHEFACRNVKALKTEGEYERKRTKYL